MSTKNGIKIHASDVTESDVLSGRGNGVANHEGNKFYTALVKHYKPYYLEEQDSHVKKEMAERILNTITSQDPPGRFLKHVEGQSFLYKLEDMKTVKKKIAQALREKRVKESKNLKNLRESMKRSMTGWNSQRWFFFSKSKGDVMDGLKQEDAGQEKGHQQERATSAKVMKEENPLYRPEKRLNSGKKGSRRDLYQSMMKSESKSKLLKESVKSFTKSETEGEYGESSQDDVKEGMLMISGYVFNSSSRSIKSGKESLNSFSPDRLNSSRSLNCSVTSVDDVTEFMRVMNTDIQNQEGASCLGGKSLHLGEF